jgi:hypothetical protein
MYVKTSSHFSNNSAGSQCDGPPSQSSNGSVSKTETNITPDQPKTSAETFPPNPRQTVKVHNPLCLPVHQPVTSQDSFTPLLCQPITSQDTTSPEYYCPITADDTSCHTSSNINNC